MNFAPSNPAKSRCFCKSVKVFVNADNPVFRYPSALDKVGVDVHGRFGLGMSELILNIQNIFAAVKKICRASVPEIVRRESVYHERNALRIEF